MHGQMPACSVAEESLFLAAFSPVAHMPAESSLLAHLRKSLALDVSETIILPVTLGVDFNRNLRGLQVVSMTWFSQSIENVYNTPFKRIFQ